MPIDPITLIITAIVAGATAGLQDTAKTAVVDAYNQLKTFLRANYQSVNVAPLEAELTTATDATVAQQQLQTQLTQAAAGDDPDLLTVAQSVIAAQSTPDDALLEQFTIEIINAQARRNLNIRDVTSKGHFRATGLKAGGQISVTDVDAEGDIDLSGLTNEPTRSDT